MPGQRLGHSNWLESKERVDQFATATSDRQWIHVDPARTASGRTGERNRIRSLLQSVADYRGGMRMSITMASPACVSRLILCACP